MASADHPHSFNWRQRPASSTSYVYPLKGILYALRTRHLWPLFRSRLVPVTILSTTITLLLLTFAYLPQAALLVLFHGKPGLLNALVLVLGESAALTQLLFEAFFLDETAVDVFDAVLVAHGHDDLVATTRPVSPDASLDPRLRLGRPTETSVYAPFSVRQVLEFVLLLPLTLVPWAGVPLFLWGTGYRSGPLLQHRYFMLRGFGKEEKREFVKKRRRAYTAFGVVAVSLQLVPVVSMGFLLTTAVGSGLWAGAMEDERLDRVEERVEEGRTEGHGESEERPPPYREIED